MAERAPRILYIQYTDPAGYPPLEHSARILADAGWQVRFLGLTKRHGITFPPHERIRVERLPDTPPGWRQKLAYFRYALWVLGAILRWRPDWLYASDVMSAPIALLATFFPGLRVLYHEHDSPEDSAPASRFMRALLDARKHLARRTALNVLPNAQRGQRFQRETSTAAPPIIVWNCPSVTELLSDVANVPGELRLLYHGSIVPERLPLTVIDALARLPACVRLHIVGYETAGAPGYVERIYRHAESLGIGQRVRFHGAMSRAALLRHAASCHIGLALMPLDPADVNLGAMAGASNKLFEYMACALALIVSPLPEWERLYVAGGFARAASPESPGALAAAVQWYLDHPGERRRMGQSGRQKILHEWNYERQFQPVLHRLAPRAGTKIARK